MDKRPISPVKLRRVPRQFSWVDQRLVRDHYIDARARASFDEGYSLEQRGETRVGRRLGLTPVQDPRALLPERLEHVGGKVDHGGLLCHSQAVRRSLVRMCHVASRTLRSGGMPARVNLYVEEACAVVNRLLLDARVVDVPMAYNPTFVMLSSLKPLFFHGLKNDLCCSDNAGASNPRNPIRAST